ncbi:M99 family carboxypeptidase catalytic domain-containing protein [Haladaptatus sp. R4]|uniref:M99 family carboxypeptidase catalytic domain-containing protein n=1 Tax=Haladaptatus sp. R4 TaxID=1679489 RepID=UPI0009ECC5B3|nr:M99 family carboxypeptidase catalytic domain-containing protein [Haladaptatus sp. R4]
MVGKESNDVAAPSRTRRSFLRRTGLVVAGTSTALATESAAREAIRTTYTIREGTPDETDVYITDTQTEGPVAVVVGGIQGNEPAGYQAAGGIKTWSINRGTLVTIPRANPVAIQRDTYLNDNGNLNRKFPPGETPTTPLARAIWGVIASYDPDIVINLHSSQGIYREDVGPDGVGQAIYPTTAPGASEDAIATAEYMNRYHVDDSFPDYYRFQRGNTIDGTRPYLVHKTDADLGVPGFIVESTRYETSLATRRNWELNIVHHLLGRHGIDRTYES